MGFPDVKVKYWCTVMQCCSLYIVYGGTNMFFLLYGTLLNFIPIPIIHCYIHSKFWLCSSVLSFFIPNCIFPYGSSSSTSREVEYQISYPENMNSIPTHRLSSFHFSQEKPPETSGKPPENLRKIPKKAENYGNSTVFMRPTNRKHIPLYGQFGLASSDYMYGIQRPEFSQWDCLKYMKKLLTWGKKFFLVSLAL